MVHTFKQPELMSGYLTSLWLLNISFQFFHLLEIFFRQFSNLSTALIDTNFLTPVEW